MGDRDDGEALTFEVKLGEIKGDNKGLCTLTEETARVSVTDTGTGEKKKSADPNKVAEIPGIMTIEEGSEKVEDDEPIIGREVVVPEDELLYGEIAGFDDPGYGNGAGDGEIQPLKTYNYGEISFKGNNGGAYWSDRAYVAGQARNDLTDWTSGGADGNGWKLSSDNDATSTLKIENMSQMYQGFHGKFEFSAGLDSGWHLSNGYAYGLASVRTASGDHTTASSNPYFWISDLKRHIRWKTGGKIDVDEWSMNSAMSSIQLQIKKYKNKSNNNVYSRITSGYLTRRTFDNNLRLRIHTANDGESGGGNVVTAPSGAASLKEDSGVYKSMKPEVMIVTDYGGVNGNGKLYVGSKVSVALTSSATYKPYSGKALNSAVYVTRSNGKEVPAEIIKGDNGTFYVTLVWDNMTEADLKDEYTINLVMTRKQEIELNLAPSVERKVNRDGAISQEIDPDKIGEAWDAFWKSGSNTITVGVSETTGKAPHYSGKVREITLSRSDWKSEDKNPLKNLGEHENVQYVNFNRDKNDRIVFNGKGYKGNEKIMLTVESLTFPKLNFAYYRAEYLDKPNTMEAFVNRVELYLDADGDGKISGKYDENTGYFLLDDDSDDEFLEILEEGAYDESGFNPVSLTKGGYGEYFAKVYYTMTPRYLVVPSGVDATGTAQVLPAFVTSRTTSEKVSNLTEEQQQYRYLMSGRKADGTRTSDDHPMYGEEATVLNYVDVPLGGDRSPLYETVPYSGEYKWDPDYVGHLIYAYDNPTPVTIGKSLLGDNKPLVDFTVDAKNGTTVMTDAARACTNGYLGSFTADTDIALCVERQEHTSDELQKAPETIDAMSIESVVLTGRTAAASGAYNSEGADGDGGSGSFDTKNSGQPLDEFNVDYNSNLMIMKESFQGFATIMQGRNKITVMISIPVASKSKSSGGENAGKWQKTTFPQTVTKTVMGGADQISSAAHDLKNLQYDKLLDNWEKQGYKDTARGGGIKSSNMSYSLSFSMILSFKYDTRYNVWYFSDFAFGAAGAFKFSYTVRLAPCPIFYAFVSVNPAVTIGTGGTVLHTEVESDKPIVTKESEKTLKRGESMMIRTPFINMKIQFKGKIYLEALDSENAKTVTSGSNKGVLNSNGEDKIQVQFKNVKDGMTFDSNRTPKYVHIVALSDVTITYLNSIEYVRNRLAWSGINIDPKVTVEAGGGVGVEGLKGEVFARIVLSASFYLGREADDGSLDSGVANVSLGVNVVLRGMVLMISWETDVIGIRIAYDGEKDKWTGYYTVMGQEKKLGSDGSSDGGGMHLPVNYSDTQTIYSSQPLSEEDVEAADDGDVDRLLAYNPDDWRVPFQLSGYNSSGEAIRLLDGVDIGYDYRVVTVDGANYVLYTISRPGGDGMDTTMLVMSRLVMTGEGYGQHEGDIEKAGAAFGDGLGLVNPLDWEEVDIGNGDKRKVVNAPADRSNVPYVCVDLAKDSRGNLSDDGTGDLGFDVEVFGDEICVAWVSYRDKVPNPDASDMTAVFQNAARNTVVKQASYDVTTKEGFSEAKVISDPDENSAVYSPTIISERLTAFVQANHVSDAERSKLVAQYAQKLNRLGYSEDGDEVRASIYSSRMHNYENNLDYKGDSSTIYVYGTEEDELFEGINYHLTPTYPSIKPIDRIKGLEMQEGTLDVAYLAYTTWEEDMDPDSKLDDHDAGLYILCMDGEDADPYQEVDVLSSFSGKLDAHKYFDALEIYDEGIRYDAIGMDDRDLLIVGQDGKIYTMHFYSGNGALSFSSLDSTEFYGGSADEHRSSYAFGADGAGNLATVYVHKVDHTSNTGLYISRYDERTRTWGKGVLLAMRHMDVHEDALRHDWDAETADQAFLGRLEGYDGGGMDQFQFDNPQIALGTKDVVSAGTGTDGGEKTVTMDDSTSNETTLVIMTQGVMRYLEELTPDDPNAGSFISPTDEQPADAAFPKGMGIYAISYGVGSQSIGEATLSFIREDFTAGAELTANISFVNGGDISIRGSEENPITVTLSVSGEGVPMTSLKSWELTENVVPGREIACAGTFTLPVTLPEGAGFHLSISEDETYAEDPYTATMRNVFLVEGKRELGFEEAVMELSRQDNGKLTIDEKGNAVINVDLFVGNRGLSDAGDVRLQFSYGIHDPAIADQVRELKGQASDWNDVIYSALDISDNTLTVGEEEALAPLGAGADELKAGILPMGVIHTGYGRHVRGTVTIPAERFMAYGLDGEDVPAGSLILRVEVYCGEEAAGKDDFGILRIERDECDDTNNQTEAIIDHTTVYAVPAQFVLPIGAMLRIPVYYTTTLGTEEPVTNAMELTDCEEGGQMMDVVAFERRNYGNGTGRGALVIRGSRTGTGYVRIQDEKTNAYQDIAIEFMDADDGIVVSTSTGIFTFYDVEGKTCKTSNDSWQFSASAYADSLRSGGKPGASFKFTTEAETIDLGFDGEVFITSDRTGFRQGTLKSDGSVKRFTFGTNPDHDTHTVTVTVKNVGSDGKWAVFTKMAEYYDAENFDVDGWTDGDSLTLLWDTHFPGRGTLKANQAFEAKLLILSDSTVNDRIQDNGVYEVTERKELTKYSLLETIRFKQNGQFKIEAANQNGAAATEAFNVDWWDEDGTETEALSSGSPALTFYETKYPDVTLHSLGIDDELEVIDNRWMSAEWIKSEGVIRVTLHGDAPMENMEAHVASLKGIFDEDFDDEDILNQKPTPIRRGESVNFQVEENDFYLVAVGADKVTTYDPALSYKVIDEYGNEETYNGEDAYYVNYQFVATGSDDAGVDDEGWEGIANDQVVQNLPDNKLTFDSVVEGDTLYLLKGGKYSYESGLEINPYVKGAVKLNAKKNLLAAKKDSMLVIRQGTEEKTVLLRTVTIKKKTITLNSRRRSFSFDEIFTGAGEMLPDVDPTTGIYAVEIKSDKNGILDRGDGSDKDYLKRADETLMKNGYVALDDFTLGSTGKKGSATITARFGGVTYKVKVKSTGYPIFDGETGSLVQNLAEADDAGNRVLTWDAVEDGDTLILAKGGKYSIEAGVEIEPAEAAYKNAVKVTVNKKSGIRKLTIKKEAPVKLSRTDASGNKEVKTVLINMVTVRKKTVTLQAGESCTLANLFPEQYELLPDTSGVGDYGGIRIALTDKNGVVSINEENFPVSSDDMTLLRDFKVGRTLRNGSAQIALSFGGRTYKATVKCK